MLLLQLLATPIAGGSIGAPTLLPAVHGPSVKGLGSFERKDVQLAQAPAPGAPPPGSLCTACGLSSTAWVAYNPTDASYWVASPPLSIDVVSGRSLTVTARLPVGHSPFGVAVDNRTGYVYVSNSGSANVTVISPTTLLSIGNISVQGTPQGLAVDTLDGTLYVADAASDNVTIVSTSSLKVLANLSVGIQPIGVTWDPSTDQIFVADHGSDSVTAISGKTATVVATFGVGAGPYGLAIDNATDQLFVADQVSNSVTVISAASDAVVATVPVAMGIGVVLEGVVYDSVHRVVWVAGGNRFAVIINPAREEVIDYVFVDPSGAAFDPVTRTVCLTNSANETFACFVFGASSTSFALDTAATVTFVESGLPAGTNWTVTIGGVRHSSQTTGTSGGTRIVFGVFQGASPYYWFNYSYRIGLVPGFVSAPSTSYVSGSGSALVRIVFS